MPQPTLGNLELINLRDLWKSEERDFTPWLAENIGQLSDLLGIPIVVEQTEKRVGSYELDIFGHGPNDVVVIVENQLEETDHTHLGQVLTYAAGLEAAVIVWVAPKVRDEHRRAIEWLNNKTVDDISFFLVRPEALSISGSLPAVRLNLEAAPSGFSRRLRGATRSGSGPWTEFLQKLLDDLVVYLDAHGHSGARRYANENYIYFNVGKTGVSVNVTLQRPPLSRISVSVWLEGEAAKRQYALFEANKTAIEAEFSGQDLHWAYSDNRNSCGLSVARPCEMDKIVEGTPEREALFPWIAENLTRFRGIAKQYLVDARPV
jgi:hypothetical protein